MDLSGFPSGSEIADMLDRGLDYAELLAIPVEQVSARHRRTGRRIELTVATGLPSTDPETRAHIDRGVQIVTGNTAAQGEYNRTGDRYFGQVALLGGNALQLASMDSLRTGYVPTADMTARGRAFVDFLRSVSLTAESATVGFSTQPVDRTGSGTPLPRIDAHANIYTASDKEQEDAQIRFSTMLPDYERKLWGKNPESQINARIILPNSDTWHICVSHIQRFRL